MVATGPVSPTMVVVTSDRSQAAQAASTVPSRWTPTASPSPERWAGAFIHVRGAHNPTAVELDEFEDEVRACAWCRLAGEQAAEALARIESER